MQLHFIAEDIQKAVEELLPALPSNVKFKPAMGDASVLEFCHKHSVVETRIEYDFVCWAEGDRFYIMVNVYDYKAEHINDETVSFTKLEQLVTYIKTLVAYVIKSNS